MNLPLITLSLEEYEEIKSLKQYIDNMCIQYESFLVNNEYKRIAYVNKSDLQGLFEILGYLKFDELKIVTFTSIDNETDWDLILCPNCIKNKKELKNNKKIYQKQLNLFDFDKKLSQNSHSINDIM